MSARHVIGALVPGRRVRQRAHTAEVRLDRLEARARHLDDLVAALAGQLADVTRHQGELASVAQQVSELRRQVIELVEASSEHVRAAERAEVVHDEIIRRSEHADARLVEQLHVLEDRVRAVEGPRTSPGR